jgi:hypothetical protein
MLNLAVRKETARILKVNVKRRSQIDGLCEEGGEGNI